MIEADRQYIEKLLKLGVLKPPVLELGTGYGGETCGAIIRNAGLRYYGTDLQSGPAVDFVANFEIAEDMDVFREVAPFGTILVLNVLEHTFDPIRILDNATRLLRPDGCLVVLTPAVWTLHNFPMDAWRVLPNFYEEYARRRRMELVAEHFDYVGFGPVTVFKNSDGTYAFPPPSRSALGRIYSRMVHRAFNTFGRSMFYPNHMAVGAVLRKAPQSGAHQGL